MKYVSLSFPPACEYTQTFRKENGKWKLDLITTEPRPVEAQVKKEEGKR